MTHTCHAEGCRAPCPPRHLMCRRCWSLVPAPTQIEVVKTAKRRGPSVDASWAEWWVAAHDAIATVAEAAGVFSPGQAFNYRARSQAFARRLREKGDSSRA